MDKKIINMIRNLGLDMINGAQSGHPGIALDITPMLYTVFAKHLRFNVNDPSWLGRDRFILSAGHASSVLYSTLFLAGYPIKEEDIRNYRKISSVCAGEPKYNKTLGVEITTGSLGEGFASSVGFAIAQEYLKNNVSKELFDYNTYVLVSDGDLMEGISYEAASLAGSLKLGSLIVLYDSNDITIDGSCDGVFNDDIVKRFESCNWHVEYVPDSENVTLIDKAIIKAKSILDKPSIIIVKSVIGLGSKYEGTSKVHSNALEEEDLLSIKRKMNMNDVPYYVSKYNTLAFREEIDKRNKPIYLSWMEKYKELIKDNNIKTIMDNLINNEYNLNLSKIKMNVDDSFNEELKITNGKLMNLLSGLIPLYLSLSADVFNNTKTYLNKGKDFKIDGEYGKNIFCGIRENLLGAVMNGLALSGFRPNGSLYLVFSDNLKPSLRMSCAMNLPVTYIFTNDSVSSSRDGITHVPVEHISSLRSIPNNLVFRPCDINEILGSWNYIVNNKSTVSLIISCEKNSKLKGTDYSLVEKGAYIVKKETSKLSGIIISSGTDIITSLKISDKLSEKGIHIRVVSVVCLELFEKQSKEYKDQILPSNVPVIVLESSNDKVWYKYVKNEKYIFGFDKFGECGSKEEETKYYKMDISYLEKKIYKLLK